MALARARAGVAPSPAARSMPTYPAETKAAIKQRSPEPARSWPAAIVAPRSSEARTVPDVRAASRASSTQGSHAVPARWW